MPSLSETRIYVKEEDDSHKRPLSEGDLPSKMPWYLKKGGQVDFNFLVKCNSPIAPYSPYQSLYISCGNMVMQYINNNFNNTSEICT